MEVQPSASQHRRLLPLDALRGLIIMLMALDHANYFIAQRHPIGEHWGGPFPSYNSALAFLTRLVTHLCAPGFFFLMGSGITLFSANRARAGWPWGRIRRHFLLRGLLLITLQFVIVNPIWHLSPIPFPRWYQGVLVALGGTMILSVVFVKAKTWLLLAASALMLLLMEFTHPDPGQWGLLFDQPLGLIFGYSGGDQTFWVNYPLLPWFELVLLGMAFGRWLDRDPRAGYQRALLLGSCLLLLFVPLRALNGFGNIRPMAGQGWIDFLNVVKYPPSMTFTLLTMGLNLVLLYALQLGRSGLTRLVNLLAVYGKAPLFLYVAHLLLYAALGRWLTPKGSSFGVMYLLWLVGLALLYPLAQWYPALKRNRRLRPILQFL